MSALRVRCACHHAFTPEGWLVDGVMHVRCHRCKQTIVVARSGGTTVTVTVTPAVAPTLCTVWDVVRWSQRAA